MPLYNPGFNAAAPLTLTSNLTLPNGNSLYLGNTASFITSDAGAEGRLQNGTSGLVVRWNNTGLGFFAANPAAKPTVSGSRGANAALASLLTALSTLGLVTDSSS